MSTTSVQDPNANSSLDACFINREIMSRPPSSKRAIPLADTTLHNSSVLLLWVIIFLLCLLPNQRIWATFTAFLTTVWFHTTYILLAALKALRADFNCAGRHPFFPNGISGHYCYFVFVLLTLIRFTRARVSANPSVSTSSLLVLSALLAIFIVGAVATLYRTFFHGYHSPRQILLGTALGLVSHVTLHILHLTQPPPTLSFATALPTLVVAAANSLLAFTLYFVLWPHVSAGPAITTTQVVFHLSLWAALTLVTRLLQASRNKHATD